MRRSLKVVPVLAATALFAAACSSGTTAEPAPTAAATGTAAASGGPQCGTTVDEIAAAAKEEGRLNLIAIPDTWANYGEILQTFRDTYGIEVVVANPDGSSADELTAVKTLEGQPDRPDSIDIGPSFTAQAIAEGLVEPYKTTNWDEIPDANKDPQGYWIGSYYGIMSFGTNTTLVKNVPQSWADLTKPEYKGMVSMNGDPREAGAAFAAVVSASLANGGSFDDIMPGIEYFAALKQSGNFLGTDVTEATLVSGDSPIALDWSYNFPGIIPKIEEAGFTFATSVPTDGPYGSYYAQSVVANANHPCAARLWMEHITGNVGAMAFLKGGAMPARFAAVSAAGLITPEMEANLPAPELIEQITFPSLEQIDAMKVQLTENWGPMVADQ